ncbi:hypothetical protein BB560_003527 [Smittium megazygosporum]|uniref:Uncharacterized protein n=1 Tax=Smittium megazygosporum TaxID=133381 RepID=A0A2T9ZBR8_9FUNG|nr:hypothetical protein BB560_003527 [Smittium megazygosporum]
MKIDFEPTSHWQNDGKLFTTDSNNENTFFPYKMSLDSLDKIFVAFPPVVAQQDELKRISNSLFEIITPNLEPDIKWQAQAILAKVYFFLGMYKECEEIIHNIPNKYSKSIFSPNYGIRLHVSLLAMKGIILEKKSLLKDALEVYNTAFSVYKSDLGPNAILVVSNITATAKEEPVNWPEEILYRRGLISLKTMKEQGLPFCFEYLNHMKNVTPPNFRQFRRAMLIRTIVRVFSEIYKSGSYERFQNILSPNAQKKLSFRYLVMDLHNQLLESLKASVAFPKPGHQNMMIIEASNISFNDWKLSHATSLSDLTQLLRIQYEYVRLTFNSPTIMRNIMNILIQFGDYHEASLAFNTYTTLARRMLDARRKEFASIFDRFGSNRTALSQQISDFENSNENESLSNIVETLVTGMDLFTTKMKKHKDVPKIYQIYLEMINSPPDTLCLGNPKDKVPPYLIARAEINIGLAYGIFLRLENSASKRCYYHQMAIDKLQNAKDICEKELESCTVGSTLYESTLKTSSDAKFYLAFQYAVGGRDIGTAIEYLKKSISENQRSIRSWHLLALLMSTSAGFSAKKGDFTSFDAHRKSLRLRDALTVCEIGLRQNHWWWNVEQNLLKPKSFEDSYDHEESNNPDPLVSSFVSIAPIDPLDSSSYEVSVEQGIEFLKLRLLYFTIKRELEGPISVLSAMPALFELYSKICGAVKAVPSEIHDASKTLLLLSEQIQNSASYISYGEVGGGSLKDYRVSTYLRTDRALSVLSASRASTVTNLAHALQPKLIAKSLARSIFSARAPVVKIKKNKNADLIQDYSSSPLSPSLANQTGKTQELNNKKTHAAKTTGTKRATGKIRDIKKTNPGSKLSFSTVDREDSVEESGSKENQASSINENLSTSPKSSLMNSSGAPNLNLFYPISENSEESSESEIESNELEESDTDSDPDSLILNELTSKTDRDGSSILDIADQQELSANKKKKSKISKKMLTKRMKKAKNIFKNSNADSRQKPEHRLPKQSKEARLSNYDQVNRDSLDYSLKRFTMDEKVAANLQGGILGIDDENDISSIGSKKHTNQLPPSTSVHYFNEAAEKLVPNYVNLPKMSAFDLDSNAIAFSDRKHRLSEYNSKVNRRASSIISLEDQRAEIKSPSSPTRNQKAHFLEKSNATKPSNIGYSDIQNLTKEQKVLLENVQASSTSSGSAYSSVYFKQTLTRLKRCHELSEAVLSNLWVFASQCFLLLEKYNDGIESLRDAALSNPLDPRILLMRSQLYLAQAHSLKRTANSNYNSLYKSSISEMNYDLFQHRISSTFVNQNGATKPKFSGTEQNIDCDNDPEFAQDDVYDSLGSDMFEEANESLHTLKDDKITNLDEQAIGELRSAVSMAPQDPDVLISLSQLEWELGNWEIAYGLANEVTQGRGWSSPEAWYILGVLEKKIALISSKNPILEPLTIETVSNVKKFAKSIYSNIYLNNSDSQFECNVNKQGSNQDKANDEAYLQTGKLCEQKPRFESSTYEINDELDLLSKGVTDLSLRSTFPSDGDTGRFASPLLYFSAGNTPSIQKAHMLTSLKSSAFTETNSVQDIPGSEILDYHAVTSTYKIPENLYRNGTIAPQVQSELQPHSSYKFFAPELTSNQGSYTKKNKNNDSHASSSWIRARQFLTFALELEDTEPIKPFESALLF